MPDRRFAALAALSLFAVTFFAFAFLFLRFPLIYDTDSYFHLAAARRYATSGIVDSLPWARFSVMHQGYGDKELLFHLLLVPFTTLTDAAIGGRLALAALNASLVALLGWLGVTLIGRWGAVVPLLVYAGASPFFARAVRLRPELLALLLLIAATWFATRRRFLLAGVAVFLFTMSYTAFHVVVGLAIVWFVQEGMRLRRWEWRLPLTAVTGAGIALLVHPHFPKNLEIWWIQNVTFFLSKRQLDVGPEILPPRAADVILKNAGWLLGLAALWIAARQTNENDEPAPPNYFASAAALFFVLYLLMARMVTWFVPLATIAVLMEMYRRGLRPSSVLTFRQIRIPLAAVVTACVLLSIPAIANPAFMQLVRSDPNAVAEGDWEEFGKRVPSGARIAATWKAAELYAFWAPQGHYLNVLDPVFMNVAYPREYRVQRAVFAGVEPDIPLAIAGPLQSDYIAFDRTDPDEHVADRVLADPRFEILYGGFNVLARITPGANADFVVDWRVVAPRAGPYPRPSSAHLRAIEGFVDVSRVDDASRCVTFATTIRTSPGTTSLYEFAPYGPSTLAVDGRSVASTQASGFARLGEGIFVQLNLGAGTHEVRVETCRVANGRGGFYLLKRSKP